MITPTEENNYTYILRCSDGTYYTGWTNNLVRRLAAHNSGKGGKYTSRRCPVELIYYEISETRQEAMSREWHIKKLTRSEKEALIRGGASVGQQTEPASNKGQQTEPTSGK